MDLPRGQFSFVNESTRQSRSEQMFTSPPRKSFLKSLCLCWQERRVKENVCGRREAGEAKREEALVSPPGEPHLVRDGTNSLQESLYKLRGNAPYNFLWLRPLCLTKRLVKGNDLFAKLVKVPIQACGGFFLLKKKKIINISKYL